MTSTSPTVYLVSGANRGIGLGLVSSLVTRPNAVVFAGARTPSKAAALEELAKKYPGALHVIKLDSGSVEDGEAAAKLIGEKYGKLDVIIANAGIANYFGPAATAPLSEFTHHFNVNTLGPIVLFQALHTLLFKSSTPQFVLISTGAACMTERVLIPVAPYGASKAAANYFIGRIHEEHEKEGLVATAISPGWVQTDMGATGAAAMGMAEAPLTIEKSVAGVLAHVDGATRAEQSGKFWDYTGLQRSW